MNTPTRPLEASGTSGEKAVMNGVMHFSVLDGWWVEGFKENAGWMLPMERAYESQTFQDELDAASIYNIIEDEIAPAFYHRDQHGLPQAWIDHIKNTVANVASNFTTNRMLDDYLRQYYRKLHDRHRALTEADYALATELAEWKKKVRREWDPIELVGEDAGATYTAPELGRNTSMNLAIYIGELKPEDVGVEIVFSKQDKNGHYQMVSTVELTLASCKDRVATYHLDFIPDVPGTYFRARRIFAKNPHLPHRQDFPLVKWV
jgi:phosphorylase/glycogen(starch) synthase